VTDYHRSEDDAIVLVTKVDGGVANTKLALSEGSGNPSSRRDGLAIKFWCEGCPAVLELTVEQHKGQTFLAWRSKSSPTTAESTE